jgi:hypothetical protein
MTTPIERTSRRGQSKPLTASWDPKENVGKIASLLSDDLPDGVFIENVAILKQIGQLPETVQPR